jgi:hypothetical protein
MRRLGLIAKWTFMPDMRRPYQPIPDVFSYMPEYTPSLEFTRKPHDTAKWQDAVRNACKIFLVGYWNQMEFDVLQFVRFINQVDPNHITDLNSENATNLSRTILFPCLSVHFHLVDDLGHSINPGHGLLGDLLFVESKEPTS